MSADRDPPRWTKPGSDAPGELRALLQAGRAPLGTPAELERLSQQLAQALGPEAGLGGSSAVAPAGRAALFASRRLGWLAVGALGGAAIWYFSAGNPNLSTVLPPAVPSRAAPAVVPPPAASPGPAPAVPLPAPEAPHKAPPPAPSEAAPQPPRSARGVAPAPLRARPGASESALLQRAQGLLGAEPARALELTREHLRQFPAGVLAEEREAIAIEALRRLGREQAANQRAAAFQIRYPGSVHQQRVQGTR